MDLTPFHLERWLLQENTFDIGSAGITKLRLGDLTSGLSSELLLNYGVTNGSELIRRRIAALYTGVDCRNVLVTSGTAEANLLVLYRLLDPGDECVILQPTYMQCAGFAESLGVTVKRCCFIEEDGYRPDLDQMKDLITGNTKLICCVNPNNPTGSIITPDEMKAICSMADSVGAWVLCDGALRGLEIGERPAATPVEEYERGIATGSLSKIGLTGLRIGWMVADRKLIEKCWADKDYTTLCHSGIGEHLGTLALQEDTYHSFISRAKGIIAEQRDFVGRCVSEHGSLLSWVVPKAGHTAFVGYSLDTDSEALCRMLLDQEEVLVAPGDFFGSSHHLRIRYSGDREELSEALARLGTFLLRMAAAG